jgi:hypothetical protein
MSTPDERSVRAVSDIYTESGVEWPVRFLGTHLHPGFEEATVALAARAAHYGFPEGGLILDLASGHCQLNGSQPDMTTISCGHDFFNTLYCVISHLVSIKLTMPSCKNPAMQNIGRQMLIPRRPLKFPERV